MLVSFVIGILGEIINFENNLNIQGLGTILSVVTMGGFIMFELRKKD